MSNDFGRDSKNYPIKTVVLGNYATGKTTLVNRLINGKFKPFTESTIGCAFFSLIVSSKYGLPFQFQIWDTAGQEKYRALTELYYRNADIILICFDVANKKTFYDVKIWLDLINDNCNNKDRLIFMIANKDDLEWDVTKEEVERFAIANKLILLVTSSVENRGITELLNTLTIKSELKWQTEMLQFSKNNETIKLEELGKRRYRCINC